jgi:hypothetical protein
LAADLAVALDRFARGVHPLPGIDNPAARSTFVEQLVESIRRVRYVPAMARRPICQARADPSSELFDPLRAAVLHQRRGEIDEAWKRMVDLNGGPPLRRRGNVDPLWMREPA